MAGRVEGKVALITGAGRGQGRSHAVRLAEEGADVIAIDVPAPYSGIGYPMATSDDLEETGKLVEALGRRVVIAEADVRDEDGLRAAVDRGVAELGRLDIVSANAGVCSRQPWDAVTATIWAETIDTNLTGVWHTAMVSVPHLIAAGGGSIICTSSSAGMKGKPLYGPYSAAKHGVTGLARSLANELAHHWIRVNTVHPTGVDTPMVRGLGAYVPDGEVDFGPLFQNALPVGILESRDISNAVLFLASDEAKYITGLEFSVDAGAFIR